MRLRQYEMLALYIVTTQWLEQSFVVICHLHVFRLTTVWNSFLLDVSFCVIPLE